MYRESMIAAGIAVYQVGEAFDVDEAGEAIADDDRQKWLVSVPADSPMVTTVLEIPLADTEDQAWGFAAIHFGVAQ